MTTINLITKIDAPKKVVFDLSRNIDVHQNSASKTNEIAIVGVTSGLINLNETVTWRGKHFSMYLTHKNRITAMVFYDYFVDEMVKGKFKSFKHKHTFVEKENKTVMIDNLNYETPFGIFGKIFDKIILKKHLTNFITELNKVLKELAEKQY
jgi:ligand-binding SRPBCC domain-containing protein